MLGGFGAVLTFIALVSSFLGVWYFISGEQVGGLSLLVFGEFEWILLFSLFANHRLFPFNLIKKV